MLNQGPPFDRRQMSAIASQIAQRGKDAEYTLFCELLEQELMRRAVHKSQDTRDLASGARWARTSADISHSIRNANALNLDRREVILDAFESIEQIDRAGQPTN